MSAPEGPTGPPGDAPQPNGEKTPANGFAKLVGGLLAIILVAAIAAAVVMVLVWALIGLYNLLFG
jgi:uncharacterized membrane protein